MTIITVTGLSHMSLSLSQHHIIQKGVEGSEIDNTIVVCVKKPITLPKFESQTLSKLTVFSFPYLQISNTATNPVKFFKLILLLKS